MTMTDTERRDDGLEAFFAAARAEPEPASEALMARVLGDALAQQRRTAPAAAPRGAVRAGRPGLLAGLFVSLGGWPAVAGLGTAAVVGLWIGFSPALGVGQAMSDALVSGAAGDLHLVDYATGFEFAFEEGEAG